MYQTERLHIEQATVDDKKFFFSLLNSPNWLQYIGDRGIKTDEDAENYIKNSLIKSYQENGFGLYKVSLKANHTPIGICGFIKRDYLDSVDIGYAVLPEFEGKGYTYEAAKATLAYGKMQLGIQTVSGITTKENVTSIHLLEKLGLKLVSTKFDQVQKKELLIFSN